MVAIVFRDGGFTRYCFPGVLLSGIKEKLHTTV